MKSIKVEIILFISILLVIICIGFGISSYITSSITLTENVDKELLQLAKQASFAVEKAIYEQFASLEVLAINDTIRNPKVSMYKKVEFMKKEAKRRI